MPIEIKQLPGESIITATVTQPFEPDKDMPSMFAEFIRLRMALQGSVALILDVSRTTDDRYAFSKMVYALAEASQGIKASKVAGLRPPIIIFVGSGPVTDLAAQAIKQEQYGGVGALLCASVDEALALAREKISQPET
jgi:hypothetical protein